MSITQVETPHSYVRAGAARGDITPPIGIYHRMWGAAVHDRATSVHRPLQATVLWLEPAAGNALQARLLVALDHCILDAAEIGRIRQAVSAATELSGEQVHVALSHTHGAGFMARSRESLPGGDKIGPYLDEVAAEVALLAAEAREYATEATILYGLGSCNLAAHRDYFDTERGHYVCGFNPEGEADSTLLVARVRAQDGRTLATLVNYACHPTTLAWDNTSISPDWIGSMRELVETATNAPCLFLQGASGDLGPREGFVGDHAVADRNGRQVGYAALSTLETLSSAGTVFEYAGPVLSGTWIGTWEHRPLTELRQAEAAAWHWERLVVDLPYREDLPTREATLANRTKFEQEETAARSAGDAALARSARANVEQMTRQLARLETLPPGPAYPFAVTVGRLGDALWVMAPGELYQAFQTTVRARLAPRLVVISTITDDWQPGYLPSAAAYGKGIYQDVISALAPGCLELLIEAVVVRLELLC